MKFDKVKYDMSKYSGPLLKNIKKKLKNSGITQEQLADGLEVEIKDAAVIDGELVYTFELVMQKEAK